MPQFSSFRNLPKKVLIGKTRWLSILLIVGAMTGCSGDSIDPCSITANIVPASASADHSAAAPGNRVQFSLVSNVQGSCPFIADVLGAWSTSDPVHTTVSNKGPTKGLATCLQTTPTSVTISNSGTVRGHKYSSASLVCK